MSQTINILFSGDIVGEPGRRAIHQLLPKLVKLHQADFCIANGENTAGGSGITPKIFTELREAGVDVITTGDHVWDQKEILPFIGNEPRLLRAVNYPPKVVGKGSVIVESRGFKIAVLNLMGRTFMKDLDCPFRAAEEEVSILRQQTPIIFVDFHAETTSEKIALGRFLDGRVSAVIGTHTHVQTADEQIFPQGTAFLCDAGMTGPHESVLGREIEPIIKRFLTQVPQKFEVAKHKIRFNGVLVQIDPKTGRALNIERLSVPLESENENLKDGGQE